MGIDLHDIPLEVFFKYFDSQNVSRDVSWSPIFSPVTVTGSYKESYTDQDGNTRVLETFLGFPLLQNTLDSGNFAMVERSLNYDLGNIDGSITHERVSTGTHTLYNLALTKLGFNYFAESIYEYCAYVKLDTRFVALTNIEVTETNGFFEITDKSFSPARNYPNAHIFPYNRTIPLPSYDKHYILGLSEQYQIMLDDKVVGYLYKNNPITKHEIDVSASSTTAIAKRYKKETLDGQTLYGSYTKDNLPQSNLIKYHNYIRNLKDKNFNKKNYKNSRIIYNAEILYANSCTEGKIYLFDYGSSSLNLKYKLLFNTTNVVTQIQSNTAEYSQNIYNASVKEIVTVNNHVLIDGIDLENTSENRFYNLFSSPDSLVIPDIVDSSKNSKIKYYRNNKGSYLSIPYNEDSEALLNVINQTTYEVLKIDGTYRYYHLDSLASLTEKGDYIECFVTPLYDYYENKVNADQAGDSSQPIREETKTRYYRDITNPSILYKVVTTTGLNRPDKYYIPDNKRGSDNLKTAYNSVKRWINALAVNSRVTPISNRISNIYDSSIKLMAINSTCNPNNTIYESLTSMDSGWIYKDYLYSNALREQMINIQIQESDREALANTGIQYTDIDGNACIGFVPIKDNIYYLIDTIPEEGLQRLEAPMFLIKDNNPTDEQLSEVNDLIETSNPFERLLNYAKYQTNDKEKDYYINSYSQSNALKTLSTNPVYTDGIYEKVDAEYSERLNSYQELKLKIINFYIEYYNNLNNERTKEHFRAIYEKRYLPKLTATFGVYQDETHVIQQSAIINDIFTKSKTDDSYKYIFTEDDASNKKLLDNLLDERGI